MPEPSAVPSNLQLLKSFRDALPYEERQDFTNYFIGSLSHGVSAEEWKHSLETAQKCVEEFRQRLQDECAQVGGAA